MKILTFSVLLLSLISGCASYNPGVFPVGPLSNNMNVQVHNDVEVFINIPDFPAKNIFSCDLEAHGLMPAYIYIKNNSVDHYSFSKKDINYEYLPAAQAAEICGFNAIVYGGIFPPTLVRVNHINNAIKEDYVSKDIPEEATIAPGENISGIIFLKQNVKLKNIIIILNNIKTNSKNIFEIDKNHALTKSNLAFIVGGKYFTQTNLHLSDGNTIYSDNYLNDKLIPLGSVVTIVEGVINNDKSDTTENAILKSASSPKSVDENAISFKTADGNIYKLKRGKHQVNSIQFERTPEIFFGKNSPLNSVEYSSMTDSEKLQIKLGKPQELMSKTLVKYTLGHPISQESPYFDGVKWSYWISEHQPLYVFFDIGNKVFKIHEGALVQNQEYAIRVERHLRAYYGVHKSKVVVDLGPPERTMSDGSNGEILVYDNFVPVKAIASWINSESFFNSVRFNNISTSSSSTVTTINSGYTESLRVSIYTDQNGSVYLVRCNTTYQEGGVIKYNK